MRHPLRAAAFALALGFSAFACAAPVAELKIENLILRDADFKETLKLNDNQKTLWKKVEDKMHDILRVRQSRAASLQTEFKTALANPQNDLRPLFGKLDEESDRTRQEDKTMRELWLEIDDALDDGQRKILFARLADYLERAEERGQPGRPGAGGGGTREPGGMRGGHGGHGGGMPRF